MSKRFVALCAAALLCVPGAVPAARMVVVASTVPDIAPGKTIDGDQPLQIPAGGELTVISQAGKMVRLEGPWSGAPGGGGGGDDPKMLDSLSRLFDDSEQESGALGAMRSASASDPVDPWSVDVTRTGTHCYAPDARVALWRDNAVASSQLTISNLTGGGRVKTAWPAGQASLAWPDGLPLADGASYAARVKGRATAAKLDMVALPADLPSDAHRAAWMADNGCVSQARRLLGLK